MDPDGRVQRSSRRLNQTVPKLQCEYILDSPYWRGSVTIPIRTWSELVIRHRSASLVADPESQPQGIRFPSPSDTTIFVIDDDPTIVEALGFFLGGRGFQVKGFEDPEKAVEAIRESPPHLVITDRDIPGLGGFDLARLALEEDPDIGVVILTGARDVELAIEAFRLGAADYLLKPLDLPGIEHTVRKALIRRTQAIFHRATEARMRREVEARTRDAEKKTALLEKVTVGALSSLVRILEERNPHFKGHSQAVAVLSEAIANELEFPADEVRSCRTAGFLHDIGMIAIPDKILDKSEALSSEESAKVKDHCRIGKDILQPFGHLGSVPDLVFCHHERLDGSGYPSGLCGRDLPFGAQVVAVADSFRALVEARPFRPAYPQGEALEILSGTSGIWHSPEVLKALARILPGSPL
jgi:putative two-component system response regulator